jgi:hypothetical protein
MKEHSSEFSTSESELHRERRSSRSGRLRSLSKRSSGDHLEEARMISDLKAVLDPKTEATESPDHNPSGEDTSDLFI